MNALKYVALTFLSVGVWLASTTSAHAGVSLSKGASGGVDINFDNSDVYVNVDGPDKGLGATVGVGFRF